MPLLPGLLPGPSGDFGTAPEERVAELLARPAGVLSVHRPVVGLDDGRCLGYQSTVRIADAGEQSSASWFRAAAQTGLSGRLGALALNAGLRERATMPGDRFLVIGLDPDALGHPDVVSVLAEEDDVSDLVLTLLSADLPPGHRAGPVLDELRSRGLQLAVGAGTGGLTELLAVERLHPDVIVLSGDLVRNVHRHRVRQRIVDTAVELAEDLGAATLAEEVESLDETQMLRTLGVRMAQGWLFGRSRSGFSPPPTEVCEWLRLQQIDLR